MKVKVMLVDLYRDGGTRTYKDEYNRLYWMSPHAADPKKVYNQRPTEPGHTGHLAWVEEIPVELDIVKHF